MAYEIRPILATFFLYEIPPIPDISSSIPNLSPLTGHDRYIIKLAFPEAVKLFGGLPKDSSGDVYRQFRVNVRRDPNMEINAEAYPNVIDLKVNEGFENKLIFGYQTWKLGVIHEMLHFWEDSIRRVNTPLS